MSIRIFYCYAHEDKALRANLEKHLANLRQQGLITSWSDRDINAGKDWAREIDTNLNNADIILLLISPDFMCSDYCYSIEMARAIAREENGTARVIPIILRHVDFEGAPFSRLNALPTDAIPVTDRKWRNRDEAFLEVAQGIRKVVKELLSEQQLYEGNIHFYREQYNEALENFELAIHYNSTNSLAYYGKGQTLSKIAAMQEDLFEGYDYSLHAIASFERAIQLNNKNIFAYIGKSRELLITHPNGSEHILELLNKAIQLDSKNAEIYEIQGDNFMLSKSHDEALKAFNKAIEFSTTLNSYVYIKKGEALEKLERYDEALETFDECIQKFPKHAYAYKKQGDILCQLERYDKALKAFEQAISLNYYQPATVYTQKGNALYHLSRYQEALAAYEQAIQLSNNETDEIKAEAYRGKGSVLQSLAKTAFEEANKLDDPLGDLDDHPF